MIVVRYIDVVPWKRWRHERLRRIWECISREEGSDKIVIMPYLNLGRETHADCLNRIWELSFENRLVDHLIITEEDFLPKLGFIELAVNDLALSEKPVLAPIRQRTNKGDTAPFFMCFDLNSLRGQRLEFRHERDPAADLHQQVSVCHFEGKLRPEVHDGWEYRYGTHLLYQRHLHDPVDMRCGDVIIGEMQERHDAFVERWLEKQSAEFWRHYESQ